MSDIDIAAIREVLHQIGQDMADDALNFDLQPFNGLTVANYLGNQGAAIARLAEIVAQLSGAEIVVVRSRASEPLDSMASARGRKAAAVRHGDREAAAKADLDLRVHKIAKAIREGCDGPPLPPAAVKALCALLSGKTSAVSA